MLKYSVYLGVETLAQSPACWMDTKETPAAKDTDAAIAQKIPRDICILTIHKSFLTKEEIIIAHTAMCCLLLPRNREETLEPSDLFLKASVCHN